ncbi:hypothetical protein BGY98DRAFT_940010 [Russula aff. rugulosa BPL654]|nr:hypothetical protein BGY98DRAFT_940010 [Russula aff. rugulosa BPL654]
MDTSNSEEGTTGTAENPMEMSDWEEDQEEELARLSKDWVAPIYAFFRPDPLIVHVDGRRCHAFECIAKSCKHKTRVVQRYLDKGDAKSTGNLRKHAKRCWGNEVVAAADKAKTARDVRDTTAKDSWTLN